MEVNDLFPLFMAHKNVSEDQLLFYDITFYGLVGCFSEREPIDIGVLPPLSP